MNLSNSILKRTLIILALIGYCDLTHSTEQDPSKPEATYEPQSGPLVFATSFATPQAAVDFAAIHGYPVTFYGMKVIVQETIKLPSNTHIIGGTWVKENNGNCLFENADKEDGNENITLEGIVFDGEHRSFGESNGIYFQNVSGIKVLNCTITRMHSSLTNIVKFNPLRLVDCSNIEISNNRMIESARSGVFIDGASENILITNNLIDRIENAGIVIKGTNKDGTLPARNVIISGNIINDAHNGAYDEGYTGKPLYNQDGAIDVYQGGDNVSITGNVIDGFGIFGNDEQATPGGQSRNLGHGIRLTQCVGAVVNGNSLVTSESFGICLYASIRRSVESKGIIFSNNSVIVRGQGDRGFVSHQSNVTFAGNHFRSDSSNSQFIVGIDIRGKSQKGVMILDNVSDVLNKSAGVQIEGSAIDCQIRGNRMENCETGILTAKNSTISRCQFTQNIFSSCRKAGIDLKGTTEASRVFGNTINNAGSVGIRLERSIWCRINDNHVESAAEFGIIVSGEQSQINGNNVIGCSQMADGKYDNIMVSGKNLLVHGNVVHVGFSINQPRYGVNIGSDSKNVMILDNLIKDGGKSADIMGIEDFNHSH